MLADLKTLKKIIESKTDKAFNVESLKELDTKVTELRTKMISNK